MLPALLLYYTFLNVEHKGPLKTSKAERSKVKLVTATSDHKRRQISNNRGTVFIHKMQLFFRLNSPITHVLKQLQKPN
jgi:hypothetical protein